MLKIGNVARTPFKPVLLKAGRLKYFKTAFKYCKGDMECLCENVNWTLIALKE